MKNKKNILSSIIILIMLFLFNYNAISQSSTATNTVGTPNTPFAAGDYLGWNNASNKIVDIKNEANKSIKFYTNAGAGAFNNQRMIIDNGNSTMSGFVGVGTLTTPASRLHVNQGGDSTVWLQLSGNRIGNAASDGLRIGVLNPNGGPFDAEFRLQEDASMRFFTGSNAGGTHFERMSLNSGTFNDAFIGVVDNNVTRVALSYGSGTNPIGIGSAPWSMLHMGQDQGGAIRRAWMNVGTTYTDNDDAAYMGMNRDTGSDQTDCVIAWADNDFPEAGPDNLRFIFLAQYSGGAGSGDPASREGRETGRFTPDGNFGVGNFYNSPSYQPARRIEALDMGRGAPQLRLTYTQATPANPTTTGVWTDFQTTSLGDLYIHPNSTATFRRVGINTSSPDNTLEIDAEATTDHNYTGGGGGISGLRFNDLSSSSSSAAAGTYTSFLTVNSTGDVVLGDPPPGGGDVLACGSPGPDGYITKWTDYTTNEICRTEKIFESPNAGNNVGIGLDLGTTPDIDHNAAQFQVDGDIGVTALHGIYINNAMTNDQKKLLGAYGTTSGTSTVALGVGAGDPTASITSGECVYVGSSAGNSATDATNCTFVGAQSGSNYIGGVSDKNSFFGYQSGENLEVGSFNTLIGADAGGSLVGTASVQDSDNTCVGASAGGAIIVGYGNTAVGRHAAGTFTTGDKNTVMGFNAELATTGGSVGTFTNCVLVGDNSQISIPTGTSVTNAMAVGSGATTGCTNCAVFGNASAIVGIGTSTPGGSGERMTVSGSGYSFAAVFQTTNIQVAGTTVTSDANLKDNINPFSNASSIISSVPVYTFTYNSQQYPQLGLPAGMRYGVMAQDIEAVLPTLITNATAAEVKDVNGNIIHPAVNYKGVSYLELIPILWQGFKEQKARVDELEQTLSECCSMTRETSSANPLPQQVYLSSGEAILYQNQPNPFDNSTLIRYFIPENAASAKIIFEDETGNVIKEVAVSDRGQGSMQVNSSTLASGIYTYSLIVNEKLVDSKKMLKAK